jgi:glycosyltransferase involved in cell wall biosynthesis
MLDHFQSLRVAVVASSLRLAGAEKQTVYMTRALHRAGIETRFYHLGGDGHYEKDLRESGMPFQRIYTPRRPWAMLAGLSMALRDWRPDIVLVPQFGDLPFGTIAGRLCGALIVGGVRSDGFYELKERGRWSRGLIRLTDGLIANSQRARQNLVSQGIPAQKIAVLPNVIDLQEFDRRAATQCEVLIPPGRIVAAAVGSLHACKRFDRFLVALMLARSHEPALLGVIAGKDCGEQTRLHCQAHALGLTPDGVLFPGEVRNVPALLARSAFLALTSDYEGFPNVILEAMAARLPVLTVPAGDAMARPAPSWMRKISETFRGAWLSLLIPTQLAGSSGRPGGNGSNRTTTTNPWRKNLRAFSTRSPPNDRAGIGVIYGCASSALPLPRKLRKGWNSEERPAGSTSCKPQRRARSSERDLGAQVCSTIPN